MSSFHFCLQSYTCLTMAKINVGENLSPYEPQTLKSQLKLNFAGSPWHAQGALDRVRA